MIDIICTGTTSGDLIFSQLKTFPRIGIEVTSQDFFIKAGGAANTAVALAKLGKNVAFVTELGKDAIGKIVYEQLIGFGLPAECILYDENYRTSVTAVLSTDIDRGFATYFAKSDFDALLERLTMFAPKSKHIHASANNPALKEIAFTAKKNNNTFSIDTAWEEDLRFGDIEECIRCCDIFFSNEIEATTLTDTTDANAAMDILSKLADCVVIKLGSKGSMIKYKGNMIHVPSFSVPEVKDMTGAGDLFCAGFLYGYLNKLSIEECGRYASASGALAVTFDGGVDESYTLDALLDILNEIK